MRVICDLFEAQLLAQRGEVQIDGVCQRIRHIHLLAARKSDLFGRTDRLLAQPRHRYGNFYRGTRLKTGRKRHLLIHHRQYATIGGIDRYNRPVIIPNRFDGRPPHVQIFSIDFVALRWISISRFQPRASADNRAGRHAVCRGCHGRCSSERGRSHARAHPWMRNRPANQWGRGHNRFRRRRGRMVVVNDLMSGLCLARFFCGIRLS